VKFQYGYVFTIWSSFGKITFWSLFWIIVVLVPKPGFLLCIEIFYLCCFELLLSIFHIFIVGSPNDPQ
jgi:hypothetical protein